MELIYIMISLVLRELSWVSMGQFERSKLGPATNPVIQYIIGIGLKDESIWVSMVTIVVASSVLTKSGWEALRGQSKVVCVQEVILSSLPYKF